MHCRQGGRWALTLAVIALLGACASKETGYGVGPQAERQALMQQANRDPAPDTPGMYLGLIDKMQSQGLYYASLAHIDAYEKQTILLRADALRMTDQPAAASDAYAKLLQTPLAARGYWGIGLLAGEKGDFGRAAQELQQAAQLVPTDAGMLSDLGYAQLRGGDVEGARVPLMKAAELDQQSRKIASNVILLMLVDGHVADAKAAMVQLDLSSDVRAAIGKQAEAVGKAVRERRMGATLAQAAIATSAGAMTNGQSPSDPARSNTSLADGLQGRLLDRPSLSR
ncbi:pilus assembly protein [Paraburkholderia fungorum]|uniref:pilus assembly protein n=1 Tax=Paraburkholderia fungorum TaxID=134537 RepID=UPI0038B725E9